MPPFSIINLLIFQGAWFSAALLKDQSLWLMLGLLLVHAVFSPSKQYDLRVVVVILPIGMAVESLMIATGLVVYHSEFLLPVWMVLLWCHLAVSFNHSLRWMQSIPAIWQSVLAALTGAGSYAAATRFGAIALPDTQILNLMMIAVIWGIQLPLMMKLAYHVTRGRLVCPVYK